MPDSKNKLDYPLKPGETGVGTEGMTRVFNRINLLLGFFFKEYDEVLNKVGNYLVARIKQRTSEGEDVSGAPFLPYSSSYKKIRGEKGLPTDVVDLFFTGSMMGAMTYETDRALSQVEIFFIPGQDESGVDNAAKAFFIQEDQDRVFFDYNDEEQAEMFKIVRTEVARRIRGR